MIGNSTLEYGWVVTWAAILHSIAPASVAYTFFSGFLPLSLQLPKFLQCWALLETGFYFLTYVHRRYYIQLPAIHPEPLSKAERQKLFLLCQESTHDFAAFLQAWFLGAPFDTIKRENAKEFMRWAFFNTAVVDPAHEDEIEEYTLKYETRLGRALEPGRGSAKCFRLTIDAVDTLHRSVVWYTCIFVVDVATQMFMRFIGYHFYRASMIRCLSIIPPRPHAFVGTRHSPSKDVNYWYYPHTSTTELPLVFLHGIGVGMFPYMSFLKEMNEGRTEAEGTIGIIAVEILSVSSRIKRAVLQKHQMCEQLRLILDHHGFDKFVLASHSYGSVISTYLLKTPDLANRITSAILVDPISILLHQPDVGINFTVRKPKTAGQWLIWYFGAKDIGVAHTLSRTFFWSENILWKEDLRNHRAVVFLAEKDSIINAPAVREYLEDNSGEKTEESMTRCGSNGTEKEMLLSDGNGRLDVVWCPDLDHGMIFDKPLWRSCMKSKILTELRRKS